VPPRQPKKLTKLAANWCQRQHQHPDDDERTNQAPTRRRTSSVKTTNQLRQDDDERGSTRSNHQPLSEPGLLLRTQGFKGFPQAQHPSSHDQQPRLFGLSTQRSPRAQHTALSSGSAHSALLTRRYYHEPLAARPLCSLYRLFLFEPTSTRPLSVFVEPASLSVGPPLGRGFSPLGQSV